MSNDNPIFDEVKSQGETPIYREVEKPEPVLGPITGEIEHVKDTSKRPQNKVWAATGGSVVGVAASTIIVWIVEASAKIDIPESVELAVPVVITAGLTFLAGYYKKN